jgi:hypothetical protein
MVMTAVYMLVMVVKEVAEISDTVPAATAVAAVLLQVHPEHRVRYL